MLLWTDEHDLVLVQAAATRQGTRAEHAPLKLSQVRIERRAVFVEFFRALFDRRN